METSSPLIFTSTDHLDQPGIKGFSLYQPWPIPSVSSRQSSKGQAAETWSISGN